MTLELCQQVIMLHSEKVGKDTIDMVPKETSFVLLVVFIDRINELTTSCDVSVFKLHNLIPAYRGVATVWRKYLQFAICDDESRTVA